MHALHRMKYIHKIQCAKKKLMKCKSNAVAVRNNEMKQFCSGSKLKYDEKQHISKQTSGLLGNCVLLHYVTIM